MASAFASLSFLAAPARATRAAAQPAAVARSNWLTTLLRPDATPEDARAALVADLFSRTASMLVGAVVVLLIGFCAYARTGSVWVLVWMAVASALYAGRLVLTARYRAHTIAHGSKGAERWAIRYTIGGVSTQFMAGLGCILCLMTHDPMLQLLSITAVTGMAGALASRNAGLPRLAFVQLGASLIPVAIGAVPLTGDPWFSLVTVCEAMYLMVLCSMVQRNHRDVMQMTRAERENARLLRRFRYLAQHDPLTSLANRAQLLDQLKTGFTRLARSSMPDESLAVLYLDLDGFKAVNDTLGHTVGDGLLCAVAERLRQVVREGDVVARLGGDEFAIVHRHSSHADAEALAQRILDKVSRPYQLGPGRPVQIGVSIGLALAPEHAQDPDGLLQRADMALYAAKTGLRKGNFCLFDADMERTARDRRSLEMDLRDTLANVNEHNNGLVLYYQPIVNFETGIVTTREALIRWKHPSRGMIGAGEFVPLAEQTGLILKLGEWVLRSACSEAVHWVDDSRVAVNVSALQLGQGGFLPEMVRDVLARTGLPADRLELEVTETALLQESVAVMTQLQELRDMGVLITLDDFGAGYSSLSYLRSFHFDRIKIDGSFVRDAAKRPTCAAIVRAVAELGQRLGAVTVAEGIENEQQLELARAEGCTEAQGFLLGRPVPADALRLQPEPIV